MDYLIKNDILLEYNEIESPSFPKYTSQLINWANQNAQGTRSKVVGQLSDLFPEFMSEEENISVSNWESWYLSKFPNAMEAATDKIYQQIL